MFFSKKMICLPISFKEWLGLEEINSFEEQFWFYLGEMAGAINFWTYAKARKDFTLDSNVFKGQELAVQKQPSGNWSCYTLDGEKKGMIPAKDIATLIESVKKDPSDAKSFIQATSVRELKKLVGEFKQSGSLSVSKSEPEPASEPELAPAPTPASIGDSSSKSLANALTSKINDSFWYYVTAKKGNPLKSVSEGEGIAIQRQSSGQFKYHDLDETSTGLIDETQVDLYFDLPIISGGPIKGKTVEEIKRMEAEVFPKKTQTPNEDQQKILNDFKNTKKNIFIEALAGSGKTTVLKMLAKEKDPKEKWLYLVFNKKNQEEGKRVFPASVEVMTTHSFLGQQVVDPNVGSAGIIKTKLEMDKKLATILDSDWFSDLILPKYNVPFSKKFRFKVSVKKLVDLAKNNALDPKENIDDKLENLIEEHEIDTNLVDPAKATGTEEDYSRQIISAAKDVLNVSLPGKNLPGKYFNPKLNGIRDQNDTLWWSAILANELVWPKYDVVLVDECQDFNAARILVIKKLMQRGARIVAVGDPNQAIYGFLGADANAFENVRSLLFSDKNRGAANFDLPTNYRSGKNIISASNQDTKVSKLQAGRKHEGEVQKNFSYENIMEKIKSEWEKLGHLAEETAFLARTNEPLFLVALRLLREKIPFTVVGKNFKDEIINFIKGVLRTQKATENSSLNEFSNLLYEMLNEKNQQWGTKIKKAGALKDWEEQTNAVLGVIGYLLETQNSYSRDVDGLMRYISMIFEGADDLDRRNPLRKVYLSSVHKSKGLEFRRVVLIRSDLFPHPKAKTPKQRNQEDNAYYVARTRPTHTLWISSDKEPGGK